MTRKRNSTEIIFLSSLVFIILGLGLGIKLIGQKDISLTENRELRKIPAFSLGTFLDSSYQDSLEDALKDQIPLSEDMKSSYNKFKLGTGQKSFLFLSPLFTNVDKALTLVRKQKTNDGDGGQETSGDDQMDGPETNKSDQKEQGSDEEISGLLAPAKLEPNYTIVPLASMYNIRESNHRIYKSMDRVQGPLRMAANVEAINQTIDKYPDLNYYLYYIESDVDIDFLAGYNYHPAYNFIKERLAGDISLSVFSVDSIVNYSRDFFRTDHHWNQRGQARGYQEIAQLLGLEPNQNLEIIELDDAAYSGSKNRDLGVSEPSEAFGLPYYELTEHDHYIKGQLTELDPKLAYLASNYQALDPASHYTSAHGYDVGYEAYDFGSVNGRKLLVVKDSFYNPIKDLLAGHFDQTHIVDLRHYQRDMDQAFDFATFVSQHEITDVLFVGYYYYFVMDEFIIK